MATIVTTTIVKKQTIRVDRYVLETLMVDLVGHDRSASSFLVYITLWNATGGRRRSTARRSHRQLAEETGLSKSAVQAAVRRLLKRRLLSVSRASRTATPEYAVLRPWQRG
jgi:DNA-binding MarR family transcriptional regulator